MKKIKKIFTILLTLLIVSFFTGCGKTATSSETSDKLTVYTSFYPVWDFTKKVGGDRIDLHSLIPEGIEAHGWEPSARDVMNLEKADVFIYSGAGMENWVDTVVSSLGNKTLTVVDTSKGIDLHEAEDEEHHDHDHGDAHIWLNPLIAKKQMEAIASALMSADPDNEDFYQQNYDHYAAEFGKLDTEFRTTLTDAPLRDIIVSHEAFGYLCREYGITQHGVEGLDPVSEPEPARLIQLIKLAEEKGIRTVFFEQSVSDRVSNTIAAAIGGTTAVLNPIEKLSDAQRINGGDYFSAMRENLDALKKALYPA